MCQNFLSALIPYKFNFFFFPSWEPEYFSGYQCFKNFWSPAYRYRRQLQMYRTSSHGKPTGGGSSTWGLSGWTTPDRKDPKGLQNIPPPPWRWGGSSTQASMPTYISILRIPQMIWVWRATVEWYIDGGKRKNSEINLSQCLCPPQIPHGLTWAFAVRFTKLYTWPLNWQAVVIMALKLD
jgi:hypothetical protein